MSDATTTIEELRNAVAAFVEARDWGRFHDPKNLAMAIAVEAAELMEHTQWARSEEIPARLANDTTRAAIADELADVFCYVLSFANATGIDIATAVRRKMEKNERKYPAQDYRGRYE